MKTGIFLIILIVFSLGISRSFAQASLRNTAELKLSLGFAEKSGTNSASVVFDPQECMYYAVFAGNGDYPIEKFDLNGKSIATAMAGVDVRGMWWNPKTKSLEVNAYNDLGYYKIDLDEKGDPTGIAIKIVSGQHQPGEQSSGVFDPVKQKVYFYSDGAVYKYSPKNGKACKRSLSLDIPVKIENINSTSMIFTGLKGIEFGLLNYVDGEVLFFDKKTGKHTGTVKFTRNPPLNDIFCFSYANKLVWLYNTDYRIWYGYDVFN